MSYFKLLNDKKYDNVPFGKQINWSSKEYSYIKEKFLNHWSKSKRKKDSFPAPQPVSIIKNELHTKLNIFNYCVCVKSDGDRYLMFCLKYEGKNKCYFVNRIFDFIEIPILFDNDNIYDMTLFDGELVIDSDNKCLYVIHDCFSFLGSNLMTENFLVRYQKVPLFISKIKDYWKSANSIAVNIVSKKFFKFKNEMEEMVEYAKTVNYPVDGYIFTPVDIGVGIYTQYTLFKWKSLNTFDFKIVNKDNYLIALIIYNGKLNSYAGISINSDKGKLFLDKLLKLSFKDGDIVECVYNKIEETFHPYRIRKDKKNPNGYKCIKATLLNVIEDITIEDFIKKSKEKK